MDLELVEEGVQSKCPGLFGCRVAGFRDLGNLGFGFRVSGSRVLGFRGLGCRVWGVGFRVSGVGFKARGLGGSRG